MVHEILLCFSQNGRRQVSWFKGAGTIYKNSDLTASGEKMSNRATDLESSGFLVCKSHIGSKKMTLRVNGF